MKTSSLCATRTGSLLNKVCLEVRVGFILRLVAGFCFLLEQTRYRRSENFLSLTLSKASYSSTVILVVFDTLSLGWLHWKPSNGGYNFSMSCRFIPSTACSACSDAGRNSALLSLCFAFALLCFRFCFALLYSVTCRSRQLGSLPPSPIAARVVVLVATGPTATLALAASLRASYEAHSLWVRVSPARRPLRLHKAWGSFVPANGPNCPIIWSDVAVLVLLSLPPLGDHPPPIVDTPHANNEARGQ